MLEAVRAARVLGEIPADRADLLARRVRGIEVPLAGDRAGHVEVRDARLDDHALALEVDLDDPVHPREGDDDAVRDGQRAAREARSRPARDEGDAVAGAEPQHRLHLGGGAGEHDAGGLRAPAGQPVAVVRRELLRLGDHEPGAERLLELVHEAGWKGHAGDPTGGLRPPRRIGSRWTSAIR